MQTYTLSSNGITVSAVSRLRRIASDMIERSERDDVRMKLRDEYGIDVGSVSDPECLEYLDKSLRRLPPALVRDCGIHTLEFKDMGPSKEYYPNHGIYCNGTLTLNSRIIDDPVVIKDPKTGEGLNRFDQTFYHELGHGWDEAKGEGSDLSLEEDWMSLSGWSKYPKAGLKRIRIKEKGTPELVGEYYYSPDAKFTRFYARRNPWDDWADTFSYYVAGLKDLLPEEKIRYFDKKLKVYYKGQDSDE